MNLLHLIVKIFKKVIKQELKKRHLILINDLKGMTRNRRMEMPVWGDYVRISMLELAANEIYEKKVSGAVAELGVYRGDFAKYINKVFPDRKLYLFDTFSGFDKKDVLYDKQHQYSINLGDFSKTNIALVFEKMVYKENCLIMPGYFPETTINVEEEFSFVSIDVDLFKPTYEGLKFFYPRVNKGGYIFVHDCVRGVKAAVRKFCEREQISYVPLTDTWQSIIIPK